MGESTRHKLVKAVSITYLLISVKNRVDSFRPREHLTVQIDVIRGKEKHVNQVGQPVLGLGDPLIQRNHALGASFLHEGDHLNQLLTGFWCFQGRFLDCGKFFTNPEYANDRYTFFIAAKIFGKTKIIFS